MNRLAILSAVALVAASAAATPATGQSTEHARLTAMSGAWDVEMTLWTRPGGPALTTKGRSTIQSLLGGLFIEEKIEGSLNGTPFTTLAWTGFNPGTRQYEATRISSTNPVRIAESGVWNEQDRRFELKATYALAGDTWTQRTVIQPTSADAMVASSYLSFGTVPEWKAVEIKYTRRPK